jgi:hypothetical protein
VVLLCHTPRKEYYKRFLLEPLPVESHLDARLHDTFNAEVVARTLENKQVWQCGSCCVLFQGTAKGGGLVGCLFW